MRLTVADNVAYTKLPVSPSFSRSRTSSVRLILDSCNGGSLWPFCTRAQEVDTSMFYMIFCELMKCCSHYSPTTLDHNWEFILAEFLSDCMTSRGWPHEQVEVYVFAHVYIYTHFNQIKESMVHSVIDLQALPIYPDLTSFLDISCAYHCTRFNCVWAANINVEIARIIELPVARFESYTIHPRSNKSQQCGFACTIWTICMCNYGPTIRAHPISLPPILARLIAKDALQTWRQRGLVANPNVSRVMPSARVNKLKSQCRCKRDVTQPVELVLKTLVVP